MNKGLQNVGRFLATGILALGVSGCREGVPTKAEDAEVSDDISAEIQVIAFHNYRQIVATIKIGNDYDVDQSLFLKTKTAHGSYSTTVEPLRAGSFLWVEQNFDQDLLIGETLELDLVNVRDDILDQLQVVVSDLNEPLPEIPEAP